MTAMTPRHSSAVPVATEPLTSPGPHTRTLTIPQACQELCISRRTLDHWMKTGKVQFIRTAGGSRRVIASTCYRAGNVHHEEHVS